MRGGGGVGVGVGGDGGIRGGVHVHGDGVGGRPGRVRQIYVVSSGGGGG